MKKFLLTRPTLVSRLMSAGVEIKIVPNPYTPGKITWECLLTDAAKQIIRDYYDEIGKPIPRQVL